MNGGMKASRHLGVARVQVLRAVRELERAHAVDIDHLMPDPPDPALQAIADALLAAAESLDDLRVEYRRAEPPAARKRPRSAREQLAYFPTADSDHDNALDDHALTTAAL